MRAFQFLFIEIPEAIPFLYISPNFSFYQIGLIFRIIRLKNLPSIPKGALMSQSAPNTGSLVEVKE